MVKEKKMFRINTNRTAFVAFVACLLIIGIQQNTAIAEYKGECWAVTQDQAGKNVIVKISAKGEIYPNVIEGFQHPQAIVVDPKNGNLWVADEAAGIIYKFNADGTVPNGFPVKKGGPRSISLNPIDGSVWVGFFYKIEDAKGNVVGARGGAVKLSADGKELANIGGLKENSVAVNIKDGSLWVADNSGSIFKYDTNGNLLLTSSVKLKEPKYIAVSPLDGSVWVADSQASILLKLDAKGNQVLKITEIRMPVSLSLNSGDGSLWVADSQGGRVVKISASGKIIAQAAGFFVPTSVSVDPKDGGAWVADQGAGDFMPGQIVKVSAQGKAAINPITGLSSPSFVTVGYWKER